jgi:RHS repeat-associated protein
MNLVRVYALLCIVTFTATFGLAQSGPDDPGAGLLPFSTQVGGAQESVNLATGSVFVNIPVRSKIGKLPFNFSFSGSFHPWIGSITGGQRWNVTAGLIAGSSGLLGGRLSDVFQGTACGGGSDLERSVYGIVDGTGALHPGYAVVHSVAACGSPSATITTSDGSGYSAYFTMGTSTLYDRSGDSSTLDLTTHLQTLTDPDGAAMQLSYSSYSSAGSYTDTLNTTPMSFSLGGAGLPDTYSFLGGDGNTQSYTITYETKTLATAFGCTSPNVLEASARTLYLPITITVPATSETYTFQYEQTPGYASSYSTGRLTKITYPSGGSVTYAYSDSNGHHGIECHTGVVPILTRTVNDNNGNVATYTYINTDTLNGTNYTVTADFPYAHGNAGNSTTVYNFRDGFQTEERDYQGAATGTPLRTSITCYNGNNSSQSACTNPTTFSGSVNQKDVYRFVYDSAGGSTASVVTTLFGSNGLPVTVKQYDWGQSFPPSGTPAFTTTTVYNGGTTCGTLSIATMQDRPCSVTVASASGQTSQTTYSYNAQGHPTQTKNWVIGTTFLTSSASFNGNGTVATKTDANTGVTHYGYASGCNSLLMTSAAYPVSSLTTSQTWDCNGGVITSTTGMDGHQTTTSYVDPMWRASNFNDAASASMAISFNSTSPYSSESTMAFNSSVVGSVTTTDGLSRAYLTQRHQSPGSTNFDSVETDYDILGRIRRTTMPYIGTIGQTNATAPATTTQYDVLNRPILTTDGGGGTTSYSYNLDDVLITVGPNPTGENTKQRQLEYDGLGRLKSVCELTSTANGGSSCGQYTPQTGFLTTYTYGANTMTVTQNAHGTTSQTRSYTYDGLGRMTLEVNPESGSTFYTYDSDSSGTCGTIAYNGDLIRKNTPQGTTCYTYDKLHRLLSKTYPSNTYTDSKYFVYDSATVNGIVLSNVLGRLAEAYTCPPTGSCATKKTDSGFMYTPRGELESSLESTPHSGGYFRVCAAYWPSGLLKSLNCIASLPYVIYGNSDGSGLDGEGRVTNIWAQSGNTPLSGVTYNNTNSTTGAIGTLTNVTYGSGDSDTFTYDPNTGRMKSYAYTVGTTQSVIGTLSWNAIGSLAHLGIADTANPMNTQTCNYVYDDLSRVINDYCGTAWHQTYSFDPFGNISKTATVGTSFLPTYNQTTNQISSLPGCPPITYDGNGNLTNDCAHTYGSDSDGIVTSIDGNGVVSDALGRQVEWSVGAGFRQVVYDPLNRKFALMNGVSILVKGFIPLPGGGTMVDTPGSWPAYYRHSDWLGSSRLATTQARGLYYDGAYAPYGEDYVGTGTTDLDFTGQNQDTAVGLYDFLYRKYSPVQGRWISPDPSGLAAVDMTNPQSWNRYAYVLNNPLSLIDPKGLQCVWDDGSYDSDDDPVDGNSDQGKAECASLGGTWIDDVTGADWSDASNQALSDEVANIQAGLQADATVYANNNQNSGDVIGFGTLLGVLTMPMHYLGHLQDIFSNRPPTMCVDTTCRNTWDIAALQRLHSELTTMESNKTGYDFWNKKSTQEILDSLKAGSPYEELVVNESGNVVQGNTRILILEQRGVNVNEIPAQIRPSELPSEY